MRAVYRPWLSMVDRVRWGELYRRLWGSSIDSLLSSPKPPSVHDPDTRDRRFFSSLSLSSLLSSSSGWTSVVPLWMKTPFVSGTVLLHGLLPALVLLWPSRVLGAGQDAPAHPVKRAQLPCISEGNEITINTIFSEGTDHLPSCRASSSTRTRRLAS